MHTVDPDRDEAAEGKFRAADLFVPGSIILVLFVGLFKGAPVLRNVPLDLTVLSVGIVSALIVGHLFLTQGRARINPWALAALGLALPAAFYPVSNSAAVNKRVELLIPLVAVVGVCFLVRSPQRSRVWVWLHVAVGVAFVATGGSGGDSAAVRFSGAGSNTIGAGRASGVAILVLLVLLITGGLGKWWQKGIALVLIIWLAIALISTGSRGPLFSCGAAVLLVAALAHNRRWVLRTLAAVAAVFAGWLLLTEATGLGAVRITKTIAGQYDLTRSRSGLWSEAAHAAAQHPLGIGWGNFWSVLSPAERLDSGYVQYPHNFFLEILLEAGWLTAAAAVVFVSVSILRLRRASYTPYSSAMLGIAIFFLLNACVSGDINDNRAMWGALAAAWTQVPRRNRITRHIRTQSLLLRDQGLYEGQRLGLEHSRMQ